MCAAVFFSQVNKYMALLVQVEQDDPIALAVAADLVFYHDVITHLGAILPGCNLA